MSFILLLFGTTTFVVVLLALIIYGVHYCLEDFSDDANGSNNTNNQNKLPNNIKVDYNNDYKLIKLPYNEYKKLSNLQKINYLLSIAYCKINDVSLVENKLNLTNVTSESLLIRDRGINAYHFQEYYDQISSIVSKLEQLENDEESENINESTSLLIDKNETDYGNNKIFRLLKRLNYNAITPPAPPYIIEDLVEINFKPTIESKFSTVLNLPVPTVNRKNNITYFECKLLEFNDSDTLLSLGLVSDANYPNYQLPGYLPYSFAIESNGNLRMTINGKNDLQTVISNESNEMIVLPKLNEGDVIGFGYRSISGSLFLTHNGKLIHEMIKHFKFNLFPCIGINSIGKSNCKVHVNLGQMGFVYIEANVKKLGFCENKNDGLIGAPPIYNKLNLKNEILLDKGDEIPPNYSNEDSFFSGVVGTSKEKEMVESTESMEQMEQTEQVATSEQVEPLQPLEQTESEEQVPKSTTITRESTPSSNPPSYDSEKQETGSSTAESNSETPTPPPSSSVRKTKSGKKNKKSKKGKKSKNKTQFK